MGAASAGAINAVLWGLNFPLQDIDSFLRNPKLFKSFEADDFDLDDAAKNQLVAAGKAGTAAFLNWYNDKSQDKPNQ